MQEDKEKSEINKLYFLYRVIINKQAPGLKLEFWCYQFVTLYCLTPQYNA